MQPAENGEKNLPRLLHISGDFPDSIQPFKTPVIRSFVDLTAHDFDHCVYSLNREPLSPAKTVRRAVGLSLPTRQVIASQAFEYGRAIAYKAPGRGLLHESMLSQLGDYIADSLASHDRQPDMIVPHKLTIEGIAAHRVAERTGLSYSLTIQGNTDRKILKARPDLRAKFREIYHEAKSVFVLTPVARAAIETLLGQRSDRARLLPAPTDLDEPMPPSLGGSGVISVFHLKNHKVKNLDTLARAAQILHGRGDDEPINIVGAGTAEETETCQNMIAKAPQMKLVGGRDRAALRTYMNEARALVMPSRAESFGLVFVEALFSGLPIIYPAGTAIDGYFDGLPFALRVDARSPEAIADAIAQAIENEADMKAALADWQKTADAKRFTRPEIAATLRQGWSDALSLTQGYASLNAATPSSDPATKSGS